MALVQPKIHWGIAFMWLVLLPAIVLLELWGLYELLSCLGWIEPIKEFLNIERPTLYG
jgi:hypothetical protein